MGEETNAYDPAGSQFDDDVTAERPTDRAAQSDQKAQAPERAAEPVKPLISMSDLPDLRNTFNPNAPLTDSDNLSRDEFTTVYDIIDKLESALDEAKPILFFPGNVRVDRDEFTEQLDQLKRMMPVQLERASALMRESERRLESAQTQANVIVSSAQSRAADTIRAVPRRSGKCDRDRTAEGTCYSRPGASQGRPSHAGSRQVLHHGDGNAATAARQAWQRRAGGIERTV